MPRPTVIKCFICKGVPDLYCGNCTRYFCTECSDKFHANRAARYHKHVRTPMTESEHALAAAHAIDPNDKMEHVPLAPSAPMVYDTPMFVYGTFSPKEDGHYIVANQCSITATADVRVETIQYGMCLESGKDLDSCIDSKVIAASVAGGTTITNMMTCPKYMYASEKYIVWMNLLSSNNGAVEYSGKFSNLTMVKLSV
jgi:hypothetical protein